MRATRAERAYYQLFRYPDGAGNSGMAAAVQWKIEEVVGQHLLIAMPWEDGDDNTTDES